jgi:hypothetical protein
MLETISAFIRKAQAYTKFAVAIIGGVLIIISTNLELPGEVVKWAQVVVAILTAFSVYAFPNVPEDVPGDHEA